VRRIALLLGLALMSGCGNSSESSAAHGPVDSAVADAEAEVASEAASDTSFPDVTDDADSDVIGGEDVVEPDVFTPSCFSNESVCVDHITRRYCDKGQWKEQTCGAGAGCVGGECVQGECSDACRLGEAEAGKVCELWDVVSGDWVASEPGQSLHDRARAYALWLHRDGMAYGGIGNARYQDPPDYKTVESLGGLGDSAIWTGTYLAAEALRLKTTDASDARKAVVDLVETLHLWFNVTGEPGVLARYVAPSNTPHPVILSDLDCSVKRCHCDVSYQGKKYDYIGHISRDQYQGVMLGYALAYEALGENDEPTRELIRQDVVKFVQELMKERTMPVVVKVNGTPVGPLNVKIRFAVINSAEMENGAVSLHVDTGKYDDSEAYGFQEFLPNLALLLKQIPLISSIVPSTVPRADSAVMLASFFSVALMVTDGVKAYENQHDEILAFYEGNTGLGGNINDWIPIMSGWFYSNSCGKGYYANNIVMEPMYNLARLEPDLGRRGVMVSHVLESRMWKTFETTKNSFFSFIYAGVAPGVSAAIPGEAKTQLAQFPPPPRIRVAVNLTQDPKYLPHQDGCPDQTQHTGAVDVGERVVSDFLWQRHPWGLFDAGDPAMTYPGVDYLVAYWLGRFHNFIHDDTVGKCAAWHG